MIDIETYYLIDYENVHGDGLSGCQDLGKKDHIVIFFTQNARNIDMSDISNHGSADLDMIEVAAGKQSTDMHIGSYLGYLAGKNGKKCRVVIVSKDTDYDKVIEFWNQRIEMVVSRTEQIKKKSTPKQQKKQQPTTNGKTAVKVNSANKTKLNQEVMQTVRKNGYDASVANTVAQIAANFYGSENILSEVHNALRDIYTDYLDVYAAIKPVLSKYVNDNPQPKKSGTTVSSSEKTSINSEIQKVLSKAGFSNDIIQFVASTAVKNLGQHNGKQLTYRAVIAQYGQNNGLNIYTHIKKII